MQDTMKGSFVIGEVNGDYLSKPDYFWLNIQEMPGDSKSFSIYFLFDLHYVVCF